MSSWGQMEAEKAFSSPARARRRASLAQRLRGCRAVCGRLAVHDETQLRSGSAPASLGLREIPLEAISGTVEPNRAAQFDSQFRPAGPTRSRWESVWLAGARRHSRSRPPAPPRRRWESVWLAAQRGALLPPISVVAVGDAYAIRDGHHRVSVARARGALTIDAIVGRA